MTLENKKPAWYSLFSADGETLSSGCLLTWLTFFMCVLYWVRDMFYPGTVTVPESLQTTLEACLMYKIGGTFLQKGKEVGESYVQKKYSSDSKAGPSKKEEEEEQLVISSKES